LRPTTARSLPPLFAFALAGCGGGAVCGNGVVESGEQCDDGARNGQPGDACSATCQSISVPLVQLQVAWSLLAMTGVPGYQGAGCKDVGAESAHVVIGGPAVADEIVPCLSYGRLYDADCPEADGGSMTSCGTHLPAGGYTATVTLLDGSGAPLTHGVSTAVVRAVAGQVATLPVDFEMKDFLAQYTGSLQLRASWGSDGTKCANATPPVMLEALRLVPMGQTAPVMGMTMPNDISLDGTPGMCFTPTTIYYSEEAKGVPWGPYTLGVEGFAQAGAPPAYCLSLPIFIGPGANNQAWSPTVPPVAQGPDGGAPSGCF